MVKICSAGKEPWHAIHPLANGRVRCPYRPVPRRQQTRDPHRIGDCTAAAGEKKRKDDEEKEEEKKERIFEDEEVEGEEEEKKTRMHSNTNTVFFHLMKPLNHETIKTPPSLQSLFDATRDTTLLTDNVCAVVICNVYAHSVLVLLAGLPRSF